MIDVKTIVNVAIGVALVMLLAHFVVKPMSEKLESYGDDDEDGDDE